MVTRRIDELKVHPKIEYFFDNLTGDKWNQFLESVRLQGILTPLVITYDGTIVSGYQRYRACKELGIKTVTCQERKFKSKDDEILAIIDSNLRQRGDVHSPSVKLGRIMLELERIYGLEEREGGGKVGRGKTSRKAVRESVGVDNSIAKCSKAIARMTEEVQELITDGVISPRVAYDHLYSRSDEEQKAVAKTIRSGGATKVHADEIKQMVQDYTVSKEGDAQMPQTNSVFSITRNILGRDMVISLTDEEAERIVRLWLQRSLETPDKIQEPETKPEWKPVKAYSTGVLAQHMDDVVRKYQQGLSPAKIGEIYGVRLIMNQ